MSIENAGHTICRGTVDYHLLDGRLALRDERHRTDKRCHLQSVSQRVEPSAQT